MAAGSLVRSNWTLYVVLLAVLAAGLKRFIAGPANTYFPDMRGQVVIITGANTGIGKETAIELLRLNATVVMAGRDQLRLQAAVADVKAAVPFADVSLEIVDLGDLKSVQAFCTAIKSKFSRLDRLVLNAGVMVPPYMTTVQGFELQWGTNHVGHHLLARELLPLIKSTPRSRIIAVSSMAHAAGNVPLTLADPGWTSRPYSRFQAYADSKHANVLMAVHLQHLLQEAGSDAVAVSLHPGSIATELPRHIPFASVLMPLLKPVLYVLMKTAWEGAQTQLYTITAPHEEMAAQAGKYFSDCAVHNENTTMFGFFPYGKLTSNPRQLDAPLAEELWHATEKLLKSHGF